MSTPPARARASGDEPPRAPRPSPAPGLLQVRGPLRIASLLLDGEPPLVVGDQPPARAARDALGMVAPRTSKPTCLKLRPARHATYPTAIALSSPGVFASSQKSARGLTTPESETSYRYQPSALVATSTPLGKRMLYPPSDLKAPSGPWLLALGIGEASTSSFQTSPPWSVSPSGPRVWCNVSP